MVCGFILTLCLIFTTFAITWAFDNQLKDVEQHSKPFKPGPKSSSPTSNIIIYHSTIGFLRIWPPPRRARWHRGPQLQICYSHSRKGHSPHFGREGCHRHGPNGHGQNGSFCVAHNAHDYGIGRGALHPSPDHRAYT